MDQKEVLVGIAGCGNLVPSLSRQGHLVHQGQVPLLDQQRDPIQGVVESKGQGLGVRPQRRPGQVVGFLGLGPLVVVRSVARSRSVKMCE